MELNKLIDHTLLKATATISEIETLCKEAVEYDFYSVCVNSGYVATAKKFLTGTDIKVCSVVGFPLGAMSAKAKYFETGEALADGADEIDMVLPIGALKDGDFQAVENDIRAVVEASSPALVKVILETCLLTKEEIKKACQLSEQAGAAFVKTSTGFSTGGATLEDIRLMKASVSPKMQIKASGGIRTKAFAEELLEAGADRIGAGNGLLLL